MKPPFSRIQAYLTILAWSLFCLPSVALDKEALLKSSFDLRLALGSFCESVYYPQSGYREIENVPGTTHALYLGFDAYVNNKLSLEPGVGICLSLGNLDNYGKEGGNVTFMPGVDIFCLIRYRFASDNFNVIAELGPSFIYFTEPESYYIDADPSDPLNGKDIYKKYDIALKPGLILQMGKHFQIGFAFPIGLTNVRKQYPELNVFGSGYFRSAQIQIGWTF